VFFVSFMHVFRRKVAQRFRWGLLIIWAFAFVGMSVFGVGGREECWANDLWVLFIPTFAAYGMAFLMVLWGRLNIHFAFLRYSFYVLILGLSALPFLSFITSRDRNPLQWPPYVPPYISILRDWTEPNEIIASDMPWAVAWYADRKSVWIPLTIQTFLDYTDWQRLGGRVAGIYLTPMSGNMQLINDIVKGDYKEWSPFILRNVNIKDFPMRTVVPLPIDNQCIFYSDRDRWTPRPD